MIFNFAYADFAGGGKHTVVINADTQQNLKTIVRRKENIARAKRAKRPIVKLKTAAGTEKIKTNQKTWMIPLQHPSVDGLWHY
ncbi:MAG: hypothetical protein PVH87_08350 [Desulfobacteraceae bacterium]